MKTLIIVLAAIFGLTGLSPIYTAKAESEVKTYYAQISSDEAYFYSDALDHESTALFVLPETYFVLLLGEEPNFYYAKYKDLYGYVKKNEVTPVSGTPTLESPNTTFRNMLLHNLEVYDKPFVGANAIASLSPVQSNVTYYGTIEGDALVPSSTHTWLYCKAGDGSSSICGFVFSYYCDTVLSPGKNTVDHLPVIEGPLSFEIVSEQPAGMSDSVIAIIILAICLPCLVVLYLLLSPAKRRRKASGVKSKPARRGKDYYEFSEDDL